ncbi:MAG: hypothetical protein RL063_382, partial [Pseudomonadota bacterium]
YLDKIPFTNQIMNLDLEILIAPCNQ